MIDFDEEPLNKKNITEEIAGHSFDLDEEPQQTLEEREPQTELAPGELHPFIGIIDMMIYTSKEPLAAAGYPTPKTDIWDTWGKPNLSKAFIQYLPLDSGAGAAISSPAFAGLIGLASLVIAFLPVILHHVTKKKEEAKAAEESEASQDSGHQQSADPSPARASVQEQPSRAKIETPDKAAEPKFVKLPGGGSEAQPNISMMELIARNMGAEQQPI